MSESLLHRYYPTETARFFDPMKIGSSAKAADAGAELILTGTKFTTSSAPWHYPDGRVPFRGALSLLLDGADRPRAIVETTRVEPRAFANIDADFAWGYGEGDRTLDGWRREMGAWYRAEAARLGARFSDDMVILCEWIRVARRFAV